MARYQQQTQARPVTQPLGTVPVPSHALAVGASGMLAGAVRGLANAGWRVSVVARNAERLERLAAEHPRIFPLVCDYTDEAAYEAALTVAFAERGAPTLALVWMHDTAPEGPQHTAHIISRSLSEEQRAMVDPEYFPDKPSPDEPVTGTVYGETAGQDPTLPKEPGEGQASPFPTTGADDPWEYLIHGATSEADLLGRDPGKPRAVCRFFHVHSSVSGDPGANVELYRRSCSLLSHIAYRAIILGRNESGNYLSHDEICDGVLDAVRADQTVYRVGEV